jgi:hypothetical protein
MNGPVTTPNRFVVQTGTDGQAKVCDAAKQRILGVIEATTRNDQDEAPIVIDGIPLVESIAVIADGDRIINDSVGRALTDNGSTGESVETCGIARGNCSVGDLIGVQLIQSNVKH